MAENATRMIRNTPRGFQSEVAHLIVIKAPGTDLQALKGRAFRLLNTRETKIGRLSDNDIVLGDDSVSRRQCDVFHDEHGWSIRNLSQTNQTAVGVLIANPGAGLNSLTCRPVTEAKLGKLDVVEIGEYRLAFYSGPWNDVEFVKYLRSVGIGQLNDGMNSVNI